MIRSSHAVKSRSASGSTCGLVWYLVLRCCVDVWSSDMKSVSVTAGGDALLPCDGPPDSAHQVLEWTRPDLKSDLYVLFHRERRTYRTYQLARFRGRVALSDPDMKGGNAAVVLRNCTANDTGVYECWVQTVGRRTGRPVVVINLTVTEPGPADDGGNPDGLAIGLLVTAFVIIAVVVSVSVKSFLSAAGGPG